MFKKKKLIVVHYVNMVNYPRERVKEAIDKYAEEYAQFKGDPNVKEIFIPTNGISRLEITKL